MEDRLETNRCTLRERIARAARSCGRDPASILMVAVTKKVEPELARALTALGSVDLGESRVPELERKVAFFRERGIHARWHFIGHIQRNKARRVVRLADVIHSVDSARLLADLARHARDEQRQPAIFLQVKLAADTAKSGVSPAELPELVELARSSGLTLAGLMTMAPLPSDDAATTRTQARATFDELARLAGTLPAEAFEDGRPRLSMGMSGDFEEAVHAGADVLRVGSALFDGVDVPSQPKREAS